MTVWRNRFNKSFIVTSSSFRRIDPGSVPEVIRGKERGREPDDEHEAYVEKVGYTGRRVIASELIVRVKPLPLHEPDVGPFN
jgi:hypothetical protein